MKDLCAAPNGDRGGALPPDVIRQSGTGGEGGREGRSAGDETSSPGGTLVAAADDDGKAAKRARRTLSVGDGAPGATRAGRRLKRERSGDMTVEEAAATLVAASTKLQPDVGAELAAELRDAEPSATAAAVGAETDARTPVLNTGTGNVPAAEALNGKRQRGSVRVKEVQALAAKVVVTPGQTRIRRNAADQAWWVVQ